LSKPINLSENGSPPTRTGKEKKNIHILVENKEKKQQTRKTS
jgi:hypothetical protein